jgi:hypothetical protein
MVVGKKGIKKSGVEGKSKKRGKKKKLTTSPIEDALTCPPSAKFFHELVVGNGLGEPAVEDASEAYRKAWESRRVPYLATSFAIHPLHFLGRLYSSPLTQKTISTCEFEDSLLSTT